MAAEDFQFASTNIDRGSYDPETRVMTLTFLRTFDTYEYQGVPPEAWNALKGALSPGRLFATEIKGRYPETWIG